MVFPIVLFIFYLDQLSKFIFTKKLALYQSLPVIKGIFHFTLVHNRGAAFGILKNQTFLFISTSFIAVILIIFSLNKHRYKRLSVYSLSLGLILAGALGNLVDRLVFGYVIDFLDFRIWPVFNVADSAITAGVVLLGCATLKSKNKNEKFNKPQDN